MVKIEGNTYNAMLGQVVHGEPQEFPVYDSYPPYGEIGEEIWVNEIVVPDTIWTQYSSGLAEDLKIYVPMELWISGNISGKQSWISAGDAYIIGDITYVNTPIGTSPDDIDTTDPDFDPNNPVLGPNHNQTDFFSLTSQKSIYIKYGHFCPISSTRVKPNTNSVYLYGSFNALGRGTGDQPWLGDGIFSYEYQFPKGSTPAQEWEGDFYENIDLHRFIYPTTPFNEWPPGLDYPWYNPLWPESGQVFDVEPIISPPYSPQITKLRGTAYVFGSISQTRRGFMRRSGNADHDTGYWDLQGLVYGSPMPSQHIGPTGYDKEYHYDYRFKLMNNFDSPAKFHVPGYEGELNVLNFFYENGSFDQPSQLILSEFKESILSDKTGDNQVYVIDREVYFCSEGGMNFELVGVIADIYEPDLFEFPGTILDIALGTDLFILESFKFFDSEINYNNRILKFDLASGTTEVYIDLVSCFGSSNILLDEAENLLFIGLTDNSDLLYKRIDNFGVFDEFIVETPFDLNQENELRNVRLYSLIDETLLDNLIFVEDQASSFGNIYHIQGEVVTLSAEEKLPEFFDLSLSYFPNPFNPFINIEFSLPEKQNVILNIYNLKGQRVCTLIDDKLGMGKQTFRWNGRSDAGSKLPSAVYFIRLSTNTITETAKILLLK